MAKVNLERRAQIGREKRARTRARLVGAARILLSSHPWAAITVEDLVAEAGLSKGAFYIHFDDMDALAAEVADELVKTIMDELIQPLRAATAEPLLRLALAAHVFLGRALKEPPWGALVAQMARSDPRVGEFAQSELREDVRRALAALPPAALSLEVAAQAVLGIILQALSAIGEGALTEPDRSGIVRAILGVIGADRDGTDAVLDRIEEYERACASPCPEPLRLTARS